MISTERYILIISIVILLIFLSAIMIASKALDIEVPDCVPASGEIFAEGKVIQLDQRTYQVNYVAKMWAFDPYTVEVPAGSEMDIYLTSNDVVHGFHINEKNVNLMAVYGTINKTTVRFDRPGIYQITCHEYCGLGHQNMAGEIIVK